MCSNGTSAWNGSLDTTGLASATYVANKATHLYSSKDVKPAVYGPGAAVGNTNQRRVLYLMNAAAGEYYSTITQVDDGDNTHYDSLRLSLLSAPV